MLVVPDNALPSDLGDEPEGFWDVIHAEVEAWLAEYGEPDDTD